MKKPIVTATRTTDDVIKELALVKIKTSSALDTVGNEVSAELKKLAELRTEIDAKRVELKELHAIEVEADQLVTLRKHREDTVTRWQDEDTEKMKRRVRDEEEYTYTLGKVRRGELDKFESGLRAQKAEFDKIVVDAKQELLGKEQALQAKLVGAELAVAELATVKEKADKSQAAAVAIACSSLKRDLEHKHEIEKLGLTNLLAAKTSECAYLQGRVTDLTGANHDLATKYESATSRVQQIATDAVNAAAQQKVVVHSGTSEPQPARR